MTGLQEIARKRTKPEPQQRVLDELVRLREVHKWGCLGISSSFDPEVNRPLLDLLGQMQVAQLLASGPEEVALIYDYLPASWGLLLLGPRPRTIEQAVRVLARNLDWYLEPPRPLFRWEWLGLGLSVVVLLYCSVAYLLLASGMIYPGQDMALLALVLSSVIWIAHAGDGRRRIWIATLHHYLAHTYQLPPLAEAPPRYVDGEL